MPSRSVELKDALCLKSNLQLQCSEMFYFWGLFVLQAHGQNDVEQLKTEHMCILLPRPSVRRVFTVLWIFHHSYRSGILFSFFRNWGLERKFPFCPKDFLSLVYLKSVCTHNWMWTRNIEEYMYVDKWCNVLHHFNSLCYVCIPE